MAAMSFIGDNSLQINADLPGDLGHHPGQCVAVIRVAWQSRDMSDELPPLQRWIGVATETLTPNS